MELLKTIWRMLRVRRRHQVDMAAMYANWRNYTFNHDDPEDKSLEVQLREAVQIVRKNNRPQGGA